LRAEAAAACAERDARAADLEHANTKITHLETALEDSRSGSSVLQHEQVLHTTPILSGIEPC
jgi:hypothetical protein